MQGLKIIALLAALVICIVGSGCASHYLTPAAGISLDDLSYYQVQFDRPSP